MRTAAKFAGLLAAVLLLTGCTSVLPGALAAVDCCVAGIAPIYGAMMFWEGDEPDRRPTVDAVVFGVEDRSNRASWRIAPYVGAHRAELLRLLRAGHALPHGLFAVAWYEANGYDFVRSTDVRWPGGPPRRKTFIQKAWPWERVR